MKTFFDGRLFVETGDITALEIDAIVNAANSSLMGGGGVDGAIHSAGGPEILRECKKLRQEDWPEGLPTGKAAITGGGRLKARHVIHTVGPVWHGGSRGEDGLLADAYRNSLRLAEEKNLSSIAFPAISTGIYGFPRDRAAGIVAGLLKEYFEGTPGLKEIRLVFFSKQDADAFLDAAGNLLK
ncbi:MAG: O-acetyl-ADP-ribose deacetylase [Spirochaetia bacterium]|jgi:O-acetyl-ADP-ribose deacetylase (regulator of RNase III)|nr:O-acetyl-ADP-ribose deacetylase [Spirochaetia bacterium]